MSADDLFTVPEAAEKLRVSPDSVRGFILSGRLSAINLALPGKRAQYRIPQAALDEFKQRCQVLQMPARQRKPKYRRYAS